MGIGRWAMLTSLTLTASRPTASASSRPKTPKENTSPNDRRAREKAKQPSGGIDTVNMDSLNLTVR